MKGIFFLIEEAAESGYVASANSQSIVTEADIVTEPKGSIREATLCHFDESKTPQVAHLSGKL